MNLLSKTKTESDCSAADDQAARMLIAALTPPCQFFIWLQWSLRNASSARGLVAGHGTAHSQIGAVV